MQWPQPESKEKHIQRKIDKNSSHFKIFGGPDENVETFDDLRHVKRMYKNNSTVRLDFSTQDRRKPLDPETYQSKTERRIFQ